MGNVREHTMELRREETVQFSTDGTPALDSQNESRQPVPDLPNSVVGGLSSLHLIAAHFTLLFVERLSLSLYACVETGHPPSLKTVDPQVKWLGRHPFLTLNFQRESNWLSPDQVSTWGQSALCREASFHSRAIWNYSGKLHIYIYFLWPSTSTPGEISQRFMKRQGYGLCTQFVGTRNWMSIAGRD